jgi:hypothetical protein
LRDLFRRPLSVVELFQYPTISALAQHISDGLAQNRVSQAEPHRVEDENRRASLRERRNLKIQRRVSKE